MSGPKLAPSAETAERQRLASDPAASAWVAANAGSGKTTVLARRVVRLLLAGAAPGRILCITFTKAAAANMANKVFDTLARWTRFDDDELRRAIAEVEGREPGGALLVRARRLFAEALETPGGLKVLTIHALCDRVLHQFPFEANVPVGFAALDERAADELMAEAQASVLAEAAERPDGALGRALATLVIDCSDMAIRDGLREAVAERALLRRLAAGGDLADIGRRLSAALGIGADDDVDALDAEVLGGAIPEARWPELASWLPNHSGKCLAEAEATADPTTKRALYIETFFTAGGTGALRAPPTDAARKRRPDLAALVDAERDRLPPLLDRRKAAACRDRSLALMRLAEAVRRRYEAAKARRGALDFADLIERTRALLGRSDAAWVLYKLDGGLDHVLVDEAQDTSPEQWDIVRRLTAEFVAGAGARPGQRTVFAVGDEKQSIFSFQGAAPAEFAETRRRYAADFAALGADFHALDLTQSFRSTAPVLDAVDRVFSREAAYSGLSSDRVATVHQPARQDGGGSVVQWEVTTVPWTQKPARAWDLPVDVGGAGQPVHVLAERIAKEVRSWLDGSGALKADPGDVLILVRTRGTLFDAILKALKGADVPVAGADRLDVTAHIAVRDLLALADVLLLPDDDLALAAVLKSPLFGFDDGDLIRLAPHRRFSLWKALAQAGTEEPRYEAAAARLVRWAAEAPRTSPFDFFARLLGAEGGRRAFRGRLGGEVDDPLDEFLRLALDFAGTATPSLSGFVLWMRAAPAVIKRDLDVAPAAVRVMTVHGAKGLEAPIVVLADLGAPDNGRHDPKVFHLREASAPPMAPDLLAFASVVAADPAALAQARTDARARALDEHRRLLYVALTRARDHLIVAGHGRNTKNGGPNVPPLSWYGLVRDGLQGHEVLPPAAPVPPTAPELPLAGISPPPWLGRPLAVEPGLARLRPSDHAPRDRRQRLARPGGEEGRQRGLLIHLLLQKLPDRPPAEREAFGLALLARDGGDWPADRRGELIAEALALMARPDLAAVFTAGGMSEVALAGRIVGPDGMPFRVSGRLDRLVDDGTTLHLVDFKTDRPVPAAVPDAYRRQLALYARLLTAAWPGRAVRASLLWTATGQLVDLPEETLIAALDNLIGA
ncbi:MAG TPA: double-strand break repair helicase AddA [Hyphomicrobiales bacterium]|nr:double-strand break repair helicase AddA [Hyphomicrobiales bacterium]